MQKKIGPYIRVARESKNLTREKAAKKLGISAGYLAHLERSGPVPLSAGLAAGLIKKLHVSRTILKLQEAHNRKSSRWYAEYRAKTARRNARKSA